MNQPLLNNLKDLHLPEPISWWPLAYGWQLIFVLLLTVIFLLVGYGYRRWQFNKPKRQALLLLAQLEKKYNQERDLEQTANQVSILLKRLCFAYLPREQIAGLYGKKWLAVFSDEPWAEMLQRANYQKADPSIDVTEIFIAVRKWIKSFDARGLNV